MEHLRYVYILDMKILVLQMVELDYTFSISELMRMKKYAYETFYDLSKTKEYNKLFLIHLGKSKTGDGNNGTFHMPLFFISKPQMLLTTAMEQI